MIEFADINLGDTVRLRNGETFAVAEKCVSYHDRQGDHPGPWISPSRDWRQGFLLSDILEIVKRNPRVCRFCGGGVTARSPETDFCRDCFYSGRADAELRAELIDGLRALPNVASADIWHTGGGCMVLAISLLDGQLATATEGEAALPEPGEPWGLICVSDNEEAWGEWDESRIEISEGSWADAELINFIGAIEARR